MANKDITNIFINQCEGENFAELCKQVKVVFVVVLLFVFVLFLNFVPDGGAVCGIIQDKRGELASLVRYTV